MLGELNFDKQGLIPAVIQDDESRQVLMVAYMNRESLARTLASGNTWFYSRSRQELWMKGETSGHIQKVKQILYDCDGDCLLVKVEQIGAACHTGHYSCFYRDLQGQETEKPLFDAGEIYGRQKGGKDTREAGVRATADILDELYALILDRKRNLPEKSYTTYLFNSGLDKILKKVGEESSEVIIAAKNHDAPEVVYETADLIYHLLVLLAVQGVTLEQVWTELSARR